MSELGKTLSKLIRDELAESQANKDNESKEYRTGKMEAYFKILLEISEDIKNNVKPENTIELDEQLEKINSIFKK
jgi:predicted house-cleaning noncanonical NTP pyrophosphatase (MazG superfamily)